MGEAVMMVLGIILAYLAVATVFIGPVAREAAMGSEPKGEDWAAGGVVSLIWPLVGFVWLMVKAGKAIDARRP